MNKEKVPYIQLRNLLERTGMELEHYPNNTIPRFELKKDASDYLPPSFEGDPEIVMHRAQTFKEIIAYLSGFAEALEWTNKWGEENDDDK